jgi:hypothetical protein
MRKIALLIACLAAAWSATTSASAEVVIFHPTVHPEATADGQVQTERTAGDGEYLLRQFLVHDRNARLVTPIHVVDGSKVFSITPDNLMYGVNANRYAEPAFCTYEITYNGRNFIGVMGHFPICLIDLNSDGAFDRMFASGFGGGPYGMLIGDFRQDIAPSPYSIVEEAAPQRLEMGIRFDPARRRAGDLEMVHIRTDGDAEVIVGGVHRIPDTLPATMTIAGARIELRAVTDGVLSFSVQSGFDPGLLETNLQEPRN